MKKGDYVEYRVGERTLRMQALEIIGDDVVLHVSSSDVRALKAGVVLRVAGAAIGITETMHDDVKLETNTVEPWRCHPYRFDQSAGDGPKGSGCRGSEDPAIALGGGVVALNQSSRGDFMNVQLVAAGNTELPKSRGAAAWLDGSSWTVVSTFQDDGASTLERFTPSTAAGKIVLRNERHREGPGAQRLNGGHHWVSAEAYSVARSPLMFFAQLMLDAGALAGEPPKEARPGEVWRGGPKPLETLTYTALVGDVAFEEAPARAAASVVARPESCAAPLQVCFGFLERTTQGHHLRRVTKRIVSWSDATSLPPQGGK